MLLFFFKYLKYGRKSPNYRRLIYQESNGNQGSKFWLHMIVDGSDSTKSHEDSQDEMTGFLSFNLDLQNK